MIYPKYIKPGDLIGITAPSDGRVGFPDEVRLDNTHKNFNELGYRVAETASVRKSVNERSADGRTRAHELHELIENKDCSFIISASGGNWLYEMLPYVDYKKIAENPTWFMGMSDPTGLCFTITTNSDVATIYQANAGEYGMQDLDPTLLDTIRILQGEKVTMHSCKRFVSGWPKYETGLENYQCDSDVKWNIITGEEKVSMKGRFLGGCLDVITNLCGTKYDNTRAFVDKYREDGMIWYFEVFSMNPETIAFTLWKLKEAGWFDTVKGFIFGRPCMVNTEYSQIGHDDAVLLALGDLGVPIITGADIGHRPPHLTIINGAVGLVNCDETGASVELELV